MLANPYPLYSRLRTEDPVHWDPFLHAWVVTRYADVVKVLHDFSADRTPSPEQFNAMGLSDLEPIAQVMVKQMLFMDAPAHTRLRALASSAFTPHRVEILRSHILEIANSLLDAVENTGRMDVIADFAAPLPAIVTAEMLGVPVADHRQLKQWSADFAEMLGNFQHNPDHVPRVLQSLRCSNRILPRCDPPTTHAAPGRSGPCVPKCRDRRGSADRGRSYRQLHYHYGWWSGNNDELDRQRHALPVKEPG